MTLLRTGVKSLINIDVLVFENFINLKTNFQIPMNNYVYNQNVNSNESTFNMFNKFMCKNNKKTNLKPFESYNCLNIMKIEDLKKMRLNNNLDELISFYENKYDFHKEALSVSSKKLKEELYNNTWFEANFEYLNITNLVRKYNIDGKTLFLTMVEDTKKYHDLWDEKRQHNGHKYFDYCGSYGLKNSYPLNIHKRQTHLNLRRYVDRSGMNGYHNLIKLFEKKILTAPNTNVVMEEMGVIDKMENKETIHDMYSNAAKIKIPSMNLEGLKIDYCNNNVGNYTNGGPVYPLDVNTNGDFDEFNKFLFDGKKNKAFDLDKYFKYVLRTTHYFKKDAELDKSNLENYVLTPLNSNVLENVSIVNCIIFGESNIRFSDVEKLLSLIRFDANHSSYKLDNFMINTMYHRFKLILNDTEINSLEFCKYQDMLRCAKWLIQLMNQINPADINHHNYHTIVSYCMFKDNIEEEYFNRLIFNEKMRIDRVKFIDN